MYLYKKIDHSEIINQFIYVFILFGCEMSSSNSSNVWANSSSVWANSSTGLHISLHLWSNTTDDSYSTYEWSIYMGFIIPALVLNIFVLTVIVTNRNLLNTSSGAIMKYLCIENVIYSLSCFSIIGMLLANHMFMAEIICNMQTMCNIFLILSIGLTLCILVYNTDRMVKFKPRFDNSQLLKIHLGIWSFSLIIAIICAVTESSPVTYCFVNLINPTQSLIFFVIICSIIIFIVHRYLSIYLYVKNVVLMTLTQKQQIIACKRMIILVLLFFITIITWICVSLYEYKLNNQDKRIFVGISIHLNVLFDPILYVLFDLSARKRLMELFCKKQSKIFTFVDNMPIYSLNKIVPEHNIITINNSNNIMTTTKLPFEEGIP